MSEEMLEDFRQTREMYNAEMRNFAMSILIGPVHRPDRRDLRRVRLIEHADPRRLGRRGLGVRDVLDPHRDCTR